MSNESLANHDKIHTTELGIVRIKRNLTLDTDDIVPSIITTGLSLRKAKR